MGEVKVESYNMGPTFNRLTSLSFHVASHSWVTTFSKFDLDNQGSTQGHGWRHSSKSQCGSNILSTDIPFVSCRSALPFLRYSIFKIWPWKSRVKVKWQECCTTTGLLRQFHRTSNGINPSSGFWDMGSAKSDPSAAWFGKFLAHGEALVGQMGKSLTLHNCRFRQVHETLNGVSIQQFQRYAFCKVWTQLDKFLAYGQAHMGQMGKWLWQCTTINTDLDNSTELRMEKIGQGLQIYGFHKSDSRPPARPPARPDHDDNTPPAQRAEG